MINIILNINNYLNCINSIKSIKNQNYDNIKLFLIINENIDIKNIFNYLKFIDMNYFIIKNFKELINYNLLGYIAFINSDSIWTNNKLNLQINFMNKNNFNISFTNGISENNNNKLNMYLEDNFIINQNFYNENQKSLESSIIIKCEIFNEFINLNNIFNFYDLIINKSIYYLNEILFKIDINLISIEIKGGLGNQLFQLFTLIAYCYENNKIFCIQDKDIEMGERKTKYLDNIFKNLSYYLITKFNYDFIYNEIKNITYTKIPDFKTNTLLSGYFQSYKYFKESLFFILNLIDFENIKKNYNLYYDFKNTVSIHFRLGDYKKFQLIHPILHITYYKNALENLIKDSNKNNWNVLYFYEYEDLEIITININILKNTFPDLNFISINNNLTDWEQMIIMSLCSHNIIANSTFSLFAAYLNNNKDRLIYYPDIWFGINLDINSNLEEYVKDLFINDNTWNKIKSNNNFDNIDIIYYINLDHRKDRNNEFQIELNKINFPINRVKRISGVYCNIGIIGCGMSHLNILKDIINNNYKNSLIFEDDFEFIDHINFKNKINYIFDQDIDYDIISLASNIQKLADCKYKNLKRLIEGQTASGYLINIKFVNTYLNNIINSTNNLINYANKGILACHIFAIDIHHKILQLDSNWYVFYPVLGKQRESFSDIEKKIMNYNC